MTDNVNYKEISQLTESLFPALYKESGGTFIAFIKAYYEWQEQSKGSAFNEGRMLLEMDDIDTTIDDFVSHFQEKYLQNFPYRTDIDTRFLVKHIMDFYRTKGSKKSLELLIKILFGEDAEIYYPSIDILKASSSEWVEPEYIEVTMSSRTKGFLDKKIAGSISGATAFVNSVVRKKINNKLIDIIFLSDVKGKFKKGELLTDDNSLKNSPMVIGSLTYFNVDNGGRDNHIGDVFDVIAEEGKGGKIRVSKTQDYTGRVDFNLIDGGAGYTLDENTQVLISNTILGVDNVEESYQDYEIIYQPVYNIYNYNSDIVTANLNLGDTIIGYNSSGNDVSKGIVIDVSNTDSNGNIINSPSSNSIIKIIENEGSFDEKLIFTLDSEPIVDTGDIIIQESIIEVEYEDLVGEFSIGERVEIIQYAAGTNNSIISSYSFGNVNSANNTVLIIDNFWGDIKENNIIKGKESHASALTKTSIFLKNPSTAKVQKVIDSDIIISDITGSFNENDLIKFGRIDNTYTIKSIKDDGITNISNANDANNRTIVYKIDYAPNDGILVGQNTTAIGIYGSNSNFYYSDKFNVPIFTKRNENNDIIKYITFKSTGQGANFGVGGLENEETFTINTDLLSANNIANVPFMSIRLDTKDSGMGIANSFNIINGGSGYSNNSVIHTKGGGYANSDIRTPITGNIETDENGKITNIIISGMGTGYYEEPDIILPETDGEIANVNLNIIYGYGFPAEPFANLDTVISKALSLKTISAGKISYLNKINPGNNYNMKPFIKVRNELVYPFKRKDLIISIENLKGVFLEGETVVQKVDGNDFKKGVVKTFTENALLIKRENFNVSFSKYPSTTDYVEIMGVTSGAVANIKEIFDDESSLNYGENAIVDTKVIAANGVITEVEVIDSGYGYIDGKGNLQSNKSPFIVSGDIVIENHGKSSGFWKTTTSHLNSEKKLHDNKYYQEYSYDIISSMSLDKYSETLKKLIHIAGTRMFGSVRIISKDDIDIKTEIIIEKNNK